MRVFGAAMGQRAWLHGESKRARRKRTAREALVLGRMAAETAKRAAEDKTKAEQALDRERSRSLWSIAKDRVAGAARRMFTTARAGARGR